MAASMKIRFSSELGDKKEFSYPCGIDDNPDLKTMLSSLRKLQENANKLLTEIVNTEKAGQIPTGGQEDQEEMEEESDDDDDEPVQEPEKKKAKT